jgi:hypothetical protein
MNKIQYVSTYISLAQEGLVTSLDCPLDQGPLMCNLEQNSDEDIVFLYCLSCSYKKIVGLSHFNTIKSEVDNAIRRTQH